MCALCGAQFVFANESVTPARVYHAACEVLPTTDLRRVRAGARVRIAQRVLCEPFVRFRRRQAERGESRDALFYRRGAESEHFDAEQRRLVLGEPTPAPQQLALATLRASRDPDQRGAHQLQRGLDEEKQSAVGRAEQRRASTERSTADRLLSDSEDSDDVLRSATTATTAAAANTTGVAKAYVTPGLGSWLSSVEANGKPPSEVFAMQRHGKTPLKTLPRSNGAASELAAGALRKVPLTAGLASTPPESARTKARLTPLARADDDDFADASSPVLPQRRFPRAGAIELDDDGSDGDSARPLSVVDADADPIEERTSSSKSSSIAGAGVRKRPRRTRVPQPSDDGHAQIVNNLMYAARSGIVAAGGTWQQRAPTATKQSTLQLTKQQQQQQQQQPQEQQTSVVVEDDDVDALIDKNQIDGKSFFLLLLLFFF